MAALLEAEMSHCGIMYLNESTNLSLPAAACMLAALWISPRWPVRRAMLCLLSKGCFYSALKLALYGLGFRSF